MFEYYLADLFDGDGEFVDVAENRLRIIRPLPERSGIRYSRSVVLVFDQDVIDGFQAALGSNNEARQDRIGDALCEFVSNVLTRHGYDPYGPREPAFTIHVDAGSVTL